MQFAFGYIALRGLGPDGTLVARNILPLTGHAPPERLEMQGFSPVGTTYF